MHIPFHPLTLADKELVQQRIFLSECRNCDFNFMNLISWRFMYETEVAEHKGWLLFRFKVEGRKAYLFPVGKGDLAEILWELIDDAAKSGHPFLMMGVGQEFFEHMDQALPGLFSATSDRAYSDYIYARNSLETYVGKKLQPKRNFVNRFVRQHPDYEILPLTSEFVPSCVELDEMWAAQKETPAEVGRYTYSAERRSLLTVFDNWEALSGQGLVVRVGDRIVAFSYGAPINHDTFDVCMEKADKSFEGAFALVCREFVKSLPNQYTLINREEDLGLEGLRHSKLSYCPQFIFHKFSVTLKHSEKRV